MLAVEFGNAGVAQTEVSGRLMEDWISEMRFMAFAMERLRQRKVGLLLYQRKPLPIVIREK